MEVKSPVQVIESASKTGAAKVELSRHKLGRLAVLSILAGAYIALGGILSFTAGFGFPESGAGNPALQKLLSGATFPIGLILVVVLGAELFTGNNAMLMPVMMSRRCSVTDVIRNWTLVYFGNFLGAMAVVLFLVFLPGLTAVEPYHAAIIKIAQAKVYAPWLTIMLKGIGANWCVCLALWLAMSGHTLTEKVIGCWFPVMAFVVLGYEHSIANMFYIPAGMLEGAAVTPWQMVWNNLIPATIGNIIGGALFVGCVHSYLHLKKN
ncbi:MAG: formate/nitrite transporter family protein [Muribaculaceae bacterium]|nr:formate/nitrite transporter family protein [Muribaculaceae bacterium]